MKYTVEFTTCGTFDCEVEADSADEAVAKAWAKLKAAEPDAEWDVHSVETEDGEEV